MVLQTTKVDSHLLPQFTSITSMRTAINSGSIVHDGARQPEVHCFDVETNAHPGLHFLYVWHTRTGSHMLISITAVSEAHAVDAPLTNPHKTSAVGIITHSTKIPADFIVIALTWSKTYHQVFGLDFPAQMRTSRALLANGAFTSLVSAHGSPMAHMLGTLYFMFVHFILFLHAEP